MFYGDMYIYIYILYITIVKGDYKSKTHGPLEKRRKPWEIVIMKEWCLVVYGLSFIIIPKKSSPTGWVETNPLVCCYNVNPRLINHGILIRGGTPPIVIIKYLNGTLPIKQPRGLLIQD